MRRVSATIEIPGARIADAEALWFDLARWPAFVEGFKHVVRVEGDWPLPGSELVWESVPDGRGRVHETVVAHEQRGGQRAEVVDPRIAGCQEVAFAAARGQDGEAAVRVTLALEYELRENRPLGALTDLFFIRRAQQDALRRTLLRFARELEADQELRAQGGD